MTVQNFDQVNLKEIRQEMEQALKSVSEKYGVSFDIGNIKFSDVEFSAKLTARVGNADGESAKKSQRELNFKTYANWFGFKPDDFNREFYLQGKKFKLTGLDTQQKKNKMIFEDMNGRTYKGTPELVKWALEQTK